MKVSSFLTGISAFVAAIALLPSTTLVQAASGKGKPGYCADSTKCAATYTCVSVQTTRTEVTDVKQCIPTAAGMPVCSGTSPGLCPSFSTTWGTSFREISSVCAYIAPDAKCSSADSTASQAKGTVTCLSVPSPVNESATIGVIYGCVDFDGSRLLFEKKSDSDVLASQFNYSSVIADKCVNPRNPSGSNFVCSSQGTCAPKSAASMDYGCQCNVGFSGTYCEKIVNNKCYHDGVCGGGSCDLATNECTNCKVGTMGDKCAQCDPTYDAAKVCSGHGTCKAVAAGTSGSGSRGNSAGETSTATPATVAPATDASAAGSAANAATVRFLSTMATTTYQCECASGYSDTQCGVKVKANSSASKTSAPSAGTSAATTSTRTSSIVGVVGLAAAALVVVSTL